MHEGKTILFYISKPSNMCFGGDDNFLLVLIRSWPSLQDKLILALNQGHPCREVFQSQLGDRATITVLKEELLLEKRARLSSRGYSPRKLAAVEFFLDALRPFQFLLAIGRLRQSIRNLRPDVLLVITGGNPPNDLTWRFLIAAWLYRVPKVILSLHNLPGRGTNWIRSLAIGALRRLTPYLCDAMVVPALANGRILAESMGTKKAFVCIPNGIDPAIAQNLPVTEKKQQLGLGRGLHIGAIGNLQERKGFAYLIQAMVPLVQRYPDIDLTLIGQDIEGYGNELIKVIHDLGLEKHVRLSGFIPNASIYCECFDVCVIPSIAFECLPFVAIEAMRYNKPVVASRVGGLPEVVIDGETGFIIPAGDAGRLTNALDRLLASPDLRAQMGEKGHALFMNRFTSQEMAKSFYSLSHEQPTTKRDAVAELEPQP